MFGQHENLGKRSLILDEIKRIPFFNKKNIHVDEELGECTNRNYKVTIQDQEPPSYVVRIPGKGTELLIDRKNEINNIDAIRESGVNVEVVYFNIKSGKMVSKYIPSKKPVDNKSLLDQTTLRDTIETIRELHCNIDKKKIQNVVNVFERNKKIFKIIEENKNSHLNIDDGFRPFYQQHELVASTIYNHHQVNHCLCHNDITPGNLIKTNKKIHVIDWEYSGKNDPMWELANLSVQSDFSDEQDKLMFTTYHKNQKTIPSSNEQRFHLYKFVVEIWRYLWAKLQLENKNDSLDKQYFLDQCDFYLNNLKRLSETTEFKGAFNPP